MIFLTLVENSFKGDIAETGAAKLGSKKKN